MEKKRNLASKKRKKNKKYANSDEEAVDKLVEKAFDSVIGKEKYTPLKTTEWMTKMIDKISSGLLKRGESRKFIVHCSIAARTASLSICSANQCCWDTQNDVAVYSEWMSSTVFGAVHVFYLTHRYSK
uniref:Dynein light chain n=1 Tax=Caenorhabditis tropicalis TaxID=1561998 RepID=A0A1I7UR25_9PELO